MSRSKNRKRPQGQRARIQGPTSPKVALGYVHGEHVSAFWHDSVDDFSWDNQDIIFQKISVFSGPKVDEPRNIIAERFLESNGTHLFMVDTDVVFPKGILRHLIKMDKDIAGGLYFLGSFDGAPVKPAIFKFSEREDGTMLIGPYYDYPQGIVKVAGMGTGCMLIKREVLEVMKEARGEDHPLPWFAFGVHNNIPIGEDVGFCLTAGKIGFESWVDTTWELPHVKPRLMTSKDYVLALSNESHPYYNERNGVPIYKELIGDEHPNLNRT